MDKNTEPFVSIVTPLYNGEEYISECIESVLSQTYKNWEYIIVNNCSKDRSLEIAHRYAETDTRIHIYNNLEFLTAFQNFNHSLRLLSPESKYCKIVHADDWLFPECIEKMVRVAEAYPSVGIVSAYCLAGTTVTGTGLPYTKIFIPGHEMARAEMLRGPYTFGTPSATMIRSDLIRSKDKFYNELESHQCTDAESCYELLQKNDYGFVHQVLSFRRAHERSITSLYEKFNAQLPSLFYSFILYGPVYLSEEEFKSAKRRRLRSYYRFLGKRINNLTDKDFLNFHKKWLDRLGFRFSWPRLIWSTLRSTLVRALDVKQHVKTIVHYARKLRGAPQHP